MSYLESNTDHETNKNTPTWLIATLTSKVEVWHLQLNKLKLFVTNFIIFLPKFTKMLSLQQRQIV